MTGSKVINKSSLRGKKCALCNQAEEFSTQDPLRYLCVHEICLELLAYNLPNKAAKALLRAVKEK